MVWEATLLLAVAKQTTRAGVHNAYIAHFAALPVDPGTVSTHMIS
jgi:hypothetical protein